MANDRRLSARDLTLGMDRRILRRDVLHGLAAGAAGAFIAPWLEGCSPYESHVERAAQDAPGYYPPALTGLRGSHAGAFEAAHALRDGKEFAPAIDTGELYDLVVVGGGISGLSAAHFQRKRAPGSRVLVLDNHDDFGGHAKRNEFAPGGALALMNGGTLMIDSPRPYGPVPAGLLAELGIDAEQLAKTIQKSEVYDAMGLATGVFFDKETFGRDQLVAGASKGDDDAGGGDSWQMLPLRAILADSPLSPRAKADLKRLVLGDHDPYPGLSSDEKKLRLSRISYRDYLAGVLKLDPAVVALFQTRTHGEWGVGIDAVSAVDCWAFDFPGFRALKLAPGPGPRMGYSPRGYAESGGSVRLHFPDGNATIARLLVRSLVPEAVPGSSVEDLVTARVDYAQLDRVPRSARIRLNATAIRVQHEGEPASAKSVAVNYLRDGRVYRVRAKGVVLACYNMIIPYLCPELPEKQKAALHELVKTPLVYTTVAVRNWRAFAKLKVRRVYAPNGYHSYFNLNPTVDIGSYSSPRSPDEPMLVHMVRTPCKPGLSEADQNRAGRAELLATSFETFERNIREQLAQSLGAGGFNPAEDITGITVNRWPHGYAHEYNPLFDGDPSEAEQPNVIGRARFGRIAIANSDAGGAAYTDSAIEQAHRAVSELSG
jgi:spermidine dehydrogenase